MPTKVIDAYLIKRGLSLNGGHYTYVMDDFGACVIREIKRYEISVEVFSSEEYRNYVRVYINKIKRWERRCKLNY